MWLVAMAVIVVGVAAVTPDSGAASAAPLASGAELRLPGPRAWPCHDFVSAMVKGVDGEDPERDSDQNDQISVEWTANGHRSQIVGKTLLGPLPAEALPREVVLVSRQPHERIRLALSCNDNPDTLSEAYENQRFKGISWLCMTSGCRAQAGYALPPQLVRSPRRLRLCSTPRKRGMGTSTCDRRHRNVRPAFLNAAAATDLAREILADARRTTDDACRVAGGCQSWVHASLATVPPAGWRITSWRVWPRDQPSRGDEGMELIVAIGAQTLRLECMARPTGGDVQGCWLEARDHRGRRLFRYQPIGEYMVPEARFERSSSGYDIELAADPENQIPATCTLSSDAFLAR